MFTDPAAGSARPHATTGAGPNSYDANGNMILRTEVSGTQVHFYTQGWTVDNRLSIVVKFDVTGTILATTTIGYDGDGVRVKKVDPSGTAYYLGTVEVLVTGTTQMTTIYYAFGGAMVAMRTAATATLTYLHGDHLGSVSLTADASGTKIAEQRFKPYGEVRWSSAAAMQTEFGFTGQRTESSLYVGSLMDYVARSYSPALGRFVSADTIVPGAGNPQALNRYSYVRNSPLGRIDPSGHEDCSTDACWQSEWAWKNRWYEAHGWFWENGGWGRQDVANFRDSNVLKDTLAEMGAVYANGLGVGWTWREMSLVGQGLVTLANRLGRLLGFAQLKSLVGGSVRLERNDTALFDRVAYTEWWFGGNKSIIHFQEPLFSQSDDYVRGMTVHEIAHIIDYQSAKGYGWFSTNLPAVDPKFLTNYARTEGGIEPFAELLSLWVFDSPTGNRYRNAIKEIPMRQDSDIAKWLQVNLGVP